MNQNCFGTTTLALKAVQDAIQRLASGIVTLLQLKRQETGENGKNYKQAMSKQMLVKSNRINSSLCIVQILSGDHATCDTRLRE